MTHLASFNSYFFLTISLINCNVSERLRPHVSVGGHLQSRDVLVCVYSKVSYGILMRMANWQDRRQPLMFRVKPEGIAIKIILHHVIFFPLFIRRSPEC